VWSKPLPVVQRAENQQIVLASTDELELKNARESLLRGLDDIITAVKANQSVQKKADELGEKGWFSSLGGVISGANDKDLASMVKTLGGSLETTQAVVQVMLRLQSRKDRFLREFQSLLIDKVVSIQSDTKTLDDNQRATALGIVSALQDQVEEQLRQYAMVDQHERSLKDISDKLDKNDLADEEFREALTVLGRNISNLKNAESHLSNQIEALQSRLKDQVDEQLRRYDLIDQHERLLKDISDRLHKNEVGDQEFREALTGLDTQTSNLKNAEAHLSSEIGHLRSKLKVTEDEFRARYTESSQRVHESSQRHEELHTTIQQMRLELRACLNDLSAKLEQTSEEGNALHRRVEQLELAWSARSTWKARLQQHSIGIASLLVALLAIAHSFRG
jgi:chromosome segregation ATPase